ncbi:MAG TPA: DUF4430 domain-containing protein [Gaiellaceae bacterium]|nr:DUF4430 domain-containing protein [Gaiellaceae bacterium]
MRLRALALAALAVALAGCGSAKSSSASATLWVTRDRGTTVLHSEQVPTGESVLQALDRVASVKTRFGGRYVRSVDGLGERGRTAWFYYVNGYLADRSAADYRLRPGDVAWWDYRAWRNPAQDPVVLGAFPQPFLSGYDGKRRPAVVISTDPRARPLAKRLHARLLAKSGATAGANVLVLSGPTRIQMHGSSPGSPVRMSFGGDPRVLLRTWPLRYRYGAGP